MGELIQALRDFDKKQKLGQNAERPDRQRAGGVSPLILRAVGDRIQNQGAYAPRRPLKGILP